MLFVVIVNITMNDVYEKFRERVEKRYRESLELAKKQRISRLEAIEDLMELSKETTPVTTSPPAIKVPLARPKPKRYGGLTAVVKKALVLVPRKFTKQDIKLVWPQVAGDTGHPFNTSSLAGCLVRLEKQGFIKKLTSGSGSIPSQYKKNEGLIKDG